MSLRASRIRILRLALREAYLAGDREAVKRLTHKIFKLMEAP